KQVPRARQKTQAWKEDHDTRNSNWRAPETRVQPTSRHGKRFQYQAASGQLPEYGDGGGRNYRAMGASSRKDWSGLFKKRLSPQKYSFDVCRRTSIQAPRQLAALNKCTTDRLST